MDPKNASTPNVAYAIPPRELRQDGHKRRVGVEIEFAGLTVDVVADIVQRLFGGRIDVTNRFSSEVKSTTHGDFRVELDSLALKEERYRSFLTSLGASEALADAVESVLDTVARQWIPLEIVTPPLAIDELKALDPLRKELLDGGAKGTRASVLYTFGFQLNPDIPAIEPESVVRYLRAFLALYDHLRIDIDVDPTRRLLSFTDPFPESYRRRVLDPRYQPDFKDLISDYLDENPTRNRALDMLPFFATLDLRTVLDRCQEPDHIKPRPTFHYRLPNSCVDDPHWSFATDWNRWVEVERLAEDGPRLSRVSRETLELLDTGANDDAIVERARSWGVACA